MTDELVRRFAQRTLDVLYSTRWVNHAPSNPYEHCLLTAMVAAEGRESVTIRYRLGHVIRLKLGEDINGDSLATWNDRQTSFAAVEELLLSIINDEQET